jgi:protein gp37
MAEKSNIQWTDATHNIARGCTKVVDETPDGERVSDCRYCYMYRDSMDSTRYDPKKVVRTKTVFDFPLKYKNQESAVWDGKPLIFTSSLTDVYHVDIDSFRDEYWEIARKSTNSIKQILTKRPERINDHTPEDFLNGKFTDTVWMGTSCGSPYGVSRIKSLVDCRFYGIKFLSIEPLWARLELPEYCHENISWVIIGGESGFGKVPNDRNVKYGYRECELEWIEALVVDCIEMNIPVFIKQMGTHLAKTLKMSDNHGGNIDEFPEHLKIREFPAKK